MLIGLPIPDQEEALRLLIRAGNAISARKKLEVMCGWPDEYGDDKEILEDINAYLGKLEERLKKCVESLDT